MGTKGTIIIQESEGRMPQELCQQLLEEGYRIVYELSLIHISEPTKTD